MTFIHFSLIAVKKYIIKYIERFESIRSQLYLKDNLSFINQCYYVITEKNAIVQIQCFDNSSKKEKNKTPSTEHFAKKRN